MGEGVIYLGLADSEKGDVIREYIAGNAIRRLVIIAPDKFPLLYDGADQVEYADAIQYVTFYRLLQEVDAQTLIVLNECLRTQNRYELTYNCLRHFLAQTEHQLIFQYLPQIDTAEDFMILFDWDTRSRWKRRKFDASLVRAEARVCANRLPLALRRVDVPASAATQTRYDREREALFATLGARDPHILPRRLYLLGGKDKAAYIQSGATSPQLSLLPASGGRAGIYATRNQRLGDGYMTYGEARPADGQIGVLEFPHRFLDWCDFLTVTRQTQFDVLVTDLKVCRWYWQRYADWTQRIHDTYKAIIGEPGL